MTVKIRKANEEDFVSIVELSNEVLEYHNRMIPGLFTPMNKKKQEILYINSSKEDDFRFFVAVKNGDVVGYLYATFKETPWHIASKSCELNEIAVKNNFQSKGIGTQLFNHLLSECKDKGLDDIRLNVYLTNTPAIKLYEKLGFEAKSLKMSKRLKE